MKIGLIDNDLVSRDNHNFPNLALMKLSSYHKSIGNEVELIGFNEIQPGTLFDNDFNEIYVSKAFTDSYTPDFIYTMKNVKIGGTGFYFDKAEPLKKEIEHIMPDYSIYDKIVHTIKNKKYYKESSIGFITRGCFRHCEFCVNKNFNKVIEHSPLSEFYDDSKSIITLLDDNLLGLPERKLKPIFEELKSTNKIIEYKQGLDIRLINKDTAETLLKMKHGEQQWYFAFDRFEFKDLVEAKLKIWHDTYIDLKNLPNTKYIKTKMYCFCGMDISKKYNETFIISDLDIVFRRIEIMFKYKTIPYIMQWNEIKQTEYKFIYQSLANWANSNFLTVIYYSFGEFIEKNNLNEIKAFFSKHETLRKHLDLRLS